MSSEHSEQKKSVDESSRSVSSTENKSPKIEESKFQMLQTDHKKDKNWFHRVAISNSFNFSIMLAIVINTILLCMERYPMSKEEQVAQEYFNFFFTFVFLWEMIFKMVGFGIKGYLRDRFNIFDWFVVVVR
jgi:hypothetical protein